MKLSSNLKYSIDIVVLLFVLLLIGTGMLIMKNPKTDEVQITFEKASTENAEQLKEVKGINLNTANKEELMGLPKIGEKTAEKILIEREEIGKFSSIEDIVKIKGISEKTLDEIKDLIYVE